MTAAASGTMVWAWMSTVLTRLPLTTTSRRLPWLGAGEAPPRLHPTKARPASALAIARPWISLAIYALVAVMWLIPDRRIEHAITVEP